MTASEWPDLVVTGVRTVAFVRSRRGAETVAMTARANLAELLLAVGDRRERYLIERRGKAPVALLCADDFLQFQLLEARRASERRDRGDAAKRGAPALARRGRGA